MRGRQSNQQHNKKPASLRLPAMLAITVLLLFFLFFFYRLFLGCRWCRFLMVQVVGNAMAVAALGEAIHNARRMGCAMAILACGHHLVFIFVTCGAGNSFVFCITCCKHDLGFLMTRSTHAIGSIGAICNSIRHMCLMATLAFCSSHFGAMGFVALGTERYLSMRIVAEAASKSGVLAFYLSEFFNLRSMTGNALFSDIVGKFNVLWGMWVCMTTQTVLEIKMRLVAVALAALRYIVLDGRTMAGMTILTGYACFVGATAGSYIGRWFCMTFCAISVGQLPRRIGCKSGH